VAKSLQMSFNSYNNVEGPTSVDKMQFSDKVKKRYVIAISTSKIPGSGTDATVYAVIVGTLGKTERINLPDDDKNARFESGRTDRFELIVEGDVGEIREIKLGLGSGAFGLDADWRLKSVELNDRNSATRYHFPCEYVVLGGPFGKTEATFKAAVNMNE